MTYIMIVLTIVLIVFAVILIFGDVVLALFADSCGTINEETPHSCG